MLKEGDQFVRKSQQTLQIPKNIPCTRGSKLAHSLNERARDLAGRRKQKEEKHSARAQTFKVFVASSLHACLHACPVLYYAVAGLRFWVLAPNVHSISCLSVCFLTAVSPESARAWCCVLRACEPSCWEGRRRSGRCARSLGVIFFKSLVREPGRILSCPSPILLRCAACKACLHVLLIYRIEFDGCATRRRVRRHHGRVACC